MLKEAVVHILHTKEGARVAMNCLWHGTAKVGIKTLILYYWSLSLEWFKRSWPNFTSNTERISTNELTSIPPEIVRRPKGFLTISGRIES